MKKSELFIKAMQAELFRKKAWIISAFCLIKENEDEWRKDPYPYRIVQTQTGHFYCDPNNKLELTKLEDSFAALAPFGIKEKLTITNKDAPNIEKEIIVTYGNLLQNWILTIWPYKGKVKYFEKRFSISDVEKNIKDRLEDDPEDDYYEVSPGALNISPVNYSEVKSLNFSAPIYVREYVQMAEAGDFLTGLTQICTWGATEKSMMAPPGIIEYRNKLLQQNKDKLDDAATIAKIEAQLVAYDAQYLKGDPSENFLLSKKSRGIVRKKLFLMTGAETGLDDDNVKRTLISTSLTEGWDVEKFPDYMNSLRAGSFNRGAETMLGGVAVKWLQRASSNIAITVDDCGTTLGRPYAVTQHNFENLVGRSIIDNGQLYAITAKEQAELYVNKRIMLRSPMYCKLTHTDWCKTCCGEKLSLNPTAMSSAISDYGSTFLSVFMASAHAKALVLAILDLESSII